MSLLLQNPNLLLQQPQQPQQQPPPYICVNQYDLPNEPDYGCTIDKPLCMIEEGEVIDGGEEEEESHGQHRSLRRRSRSRSTRPPYGQRGTYCSDYPCYKNNNDDGISIVDQGCSSSKPICVNGLGQQPLPNEPGLYCVSTIMEEDSSSTKQRRDNDIMTSLSTTTTTTTAAATTTRRQTKSSKGWGCSTRAPTSSSIVIEYEDDDSIVVFADRTRL